MRTSIPLEIIPIEDDGYHAFITARINGKKVRMLLDTGASRTVFDEEQLSTIFEGNLELEPMEKLSTGLGTNTMKSHTTSLVEFRIGKLVKDEYEVVVIDINHVNTSYALLELPQIMGVLGNDILMAHHATISYKTKRLTLEIPEKD